MCTPSAMPDPSLEDLPSAHEVQLGRDKAFQPSAVCTPLPLRRQRLQRLMLPSAGLAIPPVFPFWATDPQPARWEDLRNRVEAETVSIPRRFEDRPWRGGWVISAAHITISGGGRTDEPRRPAYTHCGHTGTSRELPRVLGLLGTLTAHMRRQERHSIGSRSRERVEPALSADTYTFGFPDDADWGPVPDEEVRAAQARPQTDGARMALARRMAQPLRMGVALEAYRRPVFFVRERRDSSSGSSSSGSSSSGTDFSDVDIGDMDPGFADVVLGALHRVGAAILVDCTCGVCLEGFDAENPEAAGVYPAACGHPLHPDCLRRMLHYTRVCPLCRAEIGRPNVG